MHAFNFLYHFYIRFVYPDFSVIVTTFIITRRYDLLAFYL